MINFVLMEIAKLSYHHTLIPLDPGGMDNVNISNIFNGNVPIC